MTMTTEELLRQLKSKEIVIFGAGFVAEMFYRALELHGAEGSLCFCAVTRAGSGQRFHGRPVLSLSEADIREDMLVCLAVHESAEDSLRETLRPYEAQTVRIYPHLFELLYGAPVRYEAALPLAALLARQDREEYWLVVRYAAVRDYLAGGRDYPRSRELYLRSLELHCGENSVVLPKLEYKLMELLMLNQGICLSTEDMLVKVWGYETEADIGVVWVYLSYLRKRLSTLGSTVEIKARRGVGYTLEVPK